MNLWEYVADGHRAVPGWLGRDDGEILAMVDQIQKTNNTGGDLFEIGAYLGRSAVLLGYFRRPGERLVVCDVFSADAADSANAAENADHYQSLTLETFRSNYRRFHEQPPQIVVCSSSDLTPERVGGPFRLVHIDGSHLYRHVRSDTLLAKRVMSHDGIVVFDDARHELPVVAGIWEAVANDGLVPILQTNKLYASWSSAAAKRYVHDLSRRLTADPRFVTVRREVAGHEFIELTYFEGRSRRRRVRDNLVPPGVATGAARLRRRRNSSPP